MNELWQWWVEINDQYSAQIRGIIFILAIIYCVTAIIDNIRNTK